jgi:hypothetical protein
MQLPDQFSRFVIFIWIVNRGNICKCMPPAQVLAEFELSKSNLVLILNPLGTPTDSRDSRRIDHAGWITGSDILRKTIGPKFQISLRVKFHCQRQYTQLNRQ